MKERKYFAMVALLSTLAAGAASAQTSAVMSASVTVAPSLSVAAAAGNNGQIRFGTLAQGAGSTVLAPSAAVDGTSGPGRFDIQGLPSASVIVTFSALPAALFFGFANISISNWQACTLTTTVNTGCAAVAVTANTPLSPFALSSGNLGVGYVFVGATLAAIGPTQTVGTYTGTVTMTVASP